MVYNIKQIYRKVRHTISHECGHNPYSLKFSDFFSKTFLGFSKMDKKNVQNQFSQKSFGKNRFCDHNEKLASQHKKSF